MLADLVARRAAGDAAAPAIVSEVDLFLRLCPAPTIGITGTKGKTTTSALTHALLAPRLGELAVLGGNIGVPLIERLPRLTPRHVVVLELSELQLPTLSRGTTVAAYTNVTADHLDRHGSLEAYRRVKRRLAELVDPAGALVLNLDDPIVAGYGAATPAPRSSATAAARCRRGGIGVAHGWIVADAIEPIAGRRRRTATDRRSRRPGHARSPSSACPARTTSRMRLAAVAVALLFGVPAAAIRRGGRGVHRRRASPGAGRRDRRRPLRQRLPGHPARRGDRGAARLRRPDRAHRRRPRQGRRPRRARRGRRRERAAAAVLIGESGPDAGAACSARPGSRSPSGRRRWRPPSRPPTRWPARPWPPAAAERGSVATVLLSPAAASFDMFEDYEARGRAFKAAVALAKLAEERRA